MSPQHTKYYGLNKLRKIVKGASNVTITPSKVYERPNQFRIEHAEGQPRLLIRTDEKGKRYESLSYGRMPRSEVLLGSHTMADETRIRNQMKGTFSLLRGQGGEMLNEQEKKKAVFIVSLTRKREDIALAGEIAIGDAVSQARIKIINPGTSPDFGRYSHPVIESIALERTDSGFRIPRGTVLKFPETRKLLANAINFLNKGIMEGHIKAGRTKTELSFLTWKDSPQKPEFFDLIELRHSPKTRKN